MLLGIKLEKYRTLQYDITTCNSSYTTHTHTHTTHTERVLGNALFHLRLDTIEGLLSGVSSIVHVSISCVGERESEGERGGERKRGGERGRF